MLHSDDESQQLSPHRLAAQRTAKAVAALRAANAATAGQAMSIAAYVDRGEEEQARALRAALAQLEFHQTKY